MNLILGTSQRVLVLPNSFRYYQVIGFFLNCGRIIYGINLGEINEFVFEDALRTGLPP